MQNQHSLQSPRAERTARDVIIQEATLIVGRFGEEALNLDEIATAAGVDLGEAREVFGDTLGLRQVLGQYHVDELEKFNLQSLGKLAPDASKAEFMKAVFKSYFDHAMANSRDFDCLISQAANTPREAAEAEDLYFGKRAATERMFDCTNDVLQDLGYEGDAKFVEAQTIVFWTGTHGVTQLGLKGLLRFQPSAARNRIWDASFESLYRGMLANLERYNNGDYDYDHSTVRSVVDHIRRHRTQLEPPRADDIRGRVIEGAKDYVSIFGVESLTTEEAAHIANVPLDSALRAFANSEELREKLIERLNDIAVEHMDLAVEALGKGDEVTPEERMRAYGIGYFVLGQDDIHAFVSLSRSSTSSIVPVSFEDNGQDGVLLMSPSYAKFLDAIRACFVAQGFEQNAWNLYLSGTVVWSAMHGLADLCAKGMICNFPQEWKLLMVQVMEDTIISGVCTGIMADQYGK